MWAQIVHETNKLTKYKEGSSTLGQPAWSNWPQNHHLRINSTVPQRRRNENKTENLIRFTPCPNMYSSNHSKFLIVAILLILLVLCSSSFAVRESEAIESLVNRLDSKKPSPSVQELAAKGVLRRLLPTHLSSFGFKIITKVIDINNFECKVPLTFSWTVSYVIELIYIRTSVVEKAAFKFAIARIQAESHLK